MKPIKGILVLEMNGAVYSKTAADDLVNTLLMNGYTVKMRQVNLTLYIEYSAEISDEASMRFPLQ